MIVASAAVVVAGCGRSNGGRLAISGSVTLAGAPLDKGTIDFRPAAGGSGLASGAAIVGGRYGIEAARGLPPGRYEVRIFSSVDAAASPGAAGAGKPPAVERIPAAFNVATTLAVEVSAERTTFDFDVPKAAVAERP